MPVVDGARLKGLVASAAFTPQKLIDELKRDPFLATQFRSGVGVWEGYSLERHTLMVMGQFERYFRGPLPFGVDRGFFRLVLAFHDIGKPRAAAEGNTKLQHMYTVPIMKRYLTALGYRPALVELAAALVSTDPLGKHTREPRGKRMKRPSVLETAATIRALAHRASVPDRTFFGLLKLLYLVDASSYTVDAGGIKALDRLFVFNRGARTMALAPEPAGRLAPLAALFGDRTL